jgi:hexosaminidase
MSYFKQNELHLHLSDNMFINYNEFDRDEALNLYSAFRLLSNSPALDGLARFSNESYTREAFDMIQQQCARRGVVIIPEIEAPAHALSIVRWKPQLGLDDPTMLNLTHHETMPTLKMIWKTFLPWFHSKTVHIGADEYSADHIPDYTRYVNEISRFIKQNSNKHARIWATFIPGKGGNTNKDVAIQHWAPYESNPLFDYINSGYQVLNSDFAIYVVPKWSPYFKQSLDLSLIFNGNPLGGAFSPNIFDRTNATRNPPRNHRAIIGHIAPLWNDWGRTASTYLEAYWSWRDGLPALADKQWGGNISIPEYDTSFAKLQPRVPGQNLDRRVESKSETIIKYDFRQSNNAVVKDLSGNKYVGKLYGCKVKDSVLYLSNGCYMETPISSKGRDYSLSFWVNPSYSKPAPLITGEDSALWAGYDHYTNITMVSASHPYSLNYTLPVGTWTHLALVGRGNSTVLEIYNKCQGQRETHTFTTRVDTGGVQASGGTRHVWLPIAFEAPVQRIGQGFEGMIKEFTLKELA